MTNRLAEAPTAGQVWGSACSPSRFIPVPRQDNTKSAALGPRFALSRLAIDIVGIIVIALAIKAMLPEAEVDRLHRQAKKFE